jgi:hypothetical protein
LGVEKVSYTGPSGTHTVSGCGLTAVPLSDTAYDPVVDPGDAGCTLTVDLSIAAGDAAEAWTVTIEIVDIEAPVIDSVTVPEDIEQATDAGVATAVVTYSLPTADDNVDAAPVVTCTPASGTTFSFGTTQVSCTAEDASGNVSDPAVTFDVKIIDTEPPEIDVPEDIEEDATMLEGAEVDFQVDFSDNVALDTYGCDAASGDVFGLGDTTVYCDAKDTSGNVASDDFDVTVSVAPEGASVEIILDDIAGQEFDNPGTDNALSGSLQQASTLLDDANEANDVAVCNKTASFLKRVEAKQDQGRISDDYADLLSEFTDGPYGLRQALGC